MAFQDVRSPMTGHGVLLEITPGQGAAAASVARRAVSAVLTEVRVDADVADDLLLVTSELVTNAVEHTEGIASLRLERSSRGLLLRVHDQGGGLPEVRNGDTRSIGGRGLRLVEALTTDWGCVEDANGKYVWAEFALDS
jgi:anti-sigma regulatory factor (Ser/Thr protein kinase)